MSVFPTQYSVLSAAALKSRITEAYGPVGTDCRLLLHGVSDTYVIEEGITPKFVFKIYRDAHRKLAEIKGELELLTILNERGAKVAYPIKDLNGDLIQSFEAAEGTRYGVLFLYAPGAPVKAMDDEQLKTVGREMALVHNITADLELSYPRKAFTFESTIVDPIKLIAPAFKNLPEEYNYLQETAPIVIEKLRQFNLQAFNYGCCHYDFLPKNFHFADDGSLMFFDFDFAGKGYLANDVMTFYVHYFLEVFTGKTTQAEADRAFKIFADSYRTVRPLLDEELAAIPYLGFGFWVFYLGFQYENFEDWSNIFFSADYLKARVALIKKWMETAFSFGL